MRRLSFVTLTTIMACMLSCGVFTAAGQTYLNTVGDPSFGVNVPVPNGYINIGNGNLHLEFPLATHKQRGDLKLNERLVYDSRIWEIVHYSGYYWWPLNIPNAQLGWRYVQGNETGTLGTSYSQTQDTSCWNGSDDEPYSINTTYYNWTDPQGTVHPFNAYSISEDVPYDCQGIQTGPTSYGYSGYATDASGYYASVTPDQYGNVNVTVKDSTGTQVYPQVIDRYGNYWSSDANGNLIDDLGRTPVIQTVSGNVTYYDVLAPNGPIQNNGTRVRYTITYGYFPISTAFDQSGVVEYQNNGGNPPLYKLAIQSIELPDGSSYQFTYDSYGEIQSETLPTGGVVNFGWSNYTDSYNNVNRWLVSSTINSAATTYTPAVISTCNSSSTGCQENVTLQKPSGDTTLYTLTLDNGAWDVNTTIYQGGVNLYAPKFASVQSYDFTQPCTIPGCSGAQYITKTSEVNTLPDANLSTQVVTTYPDPETGQVGSWGQWDYYPAGSTPTTTPTRSVQYSYQGFDLAEEIHYDQNGNFAAGTCYLFTNTATATSGIVGHGSQNAGGPYLTSRVALNSVPANGCSGTVNGVTRQSSFDDAGSLLSDTDYDGNPPTYYKYDTTDTFVVETDKPNTTAANGQSIPHVTKAQYDPSSGVVLRTDDENSVANGQAYSVHYTYEPVGGRTATVQYPDGGSTQYTYPSPTEVDKTIAQSGSVSTLTQSILDSYGRDYQTISGGISTEIGYDGNGRKYSVSAQHLSSSSPTDGVTYTDYDALDRVSATINPDGSAKSFMYLGNVLTVTDELFNQKREIFDAFNEVSSITESDPVTGALDLETDYQRDGQGNVICVEQHGNASGTGCSSSMSSDPSSLWRIRRFFYNPLGRMVAAEIPEHMSLPSTPPSQGCSLSLGNVWTDCYTYDGNGNLSQTTDNSGGGTSYIYDALNRVMTQTSSTVHNVYTYDAGGALNGIGLLASQESQKYLNGSYTTYNQTAFAYDVMGRTTEEASCRAAGCATPTVYSTSVTYDLAGNVTSVIYPDGREIQNAYDTLNRPASVIYQQWQYPSGPTIGSTYWSAGSYAPPGQLTSATYGNGIMQMNSGFNSRQAVSSLGYQANGATIFDKTYQWDKNGSNLITQIDNPTSTYRTFGYDKLNRLISAEDLNGSSTPSTGTAAVSGFERFQMQCPGQGGLEQSMSKQSQGVNPDYSIGCIRVWDSGSVTLTVDTFSVWVGYGQGSTSSTIASELATDLNTSNSPVTATVSGATLTLTSKATGTAADYSLSYEDDGSGDFDLSLSGSTMTGGQNGAPIPGGLNQQYTLDAWGNLSSMGSIGFSQPVNNQNQVATYSYDAGGRLLSDGVTNYTYDSNGMLLTSSDGATYSYDGKEQRASVTAGGAENDYYYFGGRLYAIQGPTGWTDLVYAGSQRIATVAGAQTAAPIYDVLNYVGSEVATINGGNGSQTSLDYTPHGQIISGGNTDGFIFTGLQRDPNGLDHADMRQYASISGRWTTADPYSGSYDLENPQTLNRYAYVNNNPLGFVDPSGEAGAGILTGVGGSLCGDWRPVGSTNICSPLISVVSKGIDKMFGLAPTTFAAGSVGPILSFGVTFGCGFISSSETKSSFCGQSGWTALFSKKHPDLATGINDGIAAVGLADGLALASEASAAGISSTAELATCFAGGPANLVCDVAIALMVYTALNDIFSLVWDFIKPNHFTGSMLPRPSARGGLGEDPIGIPNRDLSHRNLVNP